MLNLFVNVHGWFSAGTICFLGLAFRLVKVTEREPAVACFVSNIESLPLTECIRARVVQWSEAQLSNLVMCGRISLYAQYYLFYVGGGGGDRAWLDIKYQL